MTRNDLSRHLRAARGSGPDFLPASRRSSPATRGKRDPAKTAKKRGTDEAWEALRERALSCTQCGLAERRTQVVFGVGPVHTPLMFVGEGPGQQEDETGEPFVGRAGQLLTRTLNQLGVKRSQVYIANIVKCRPPGNRTPLREEVMACMPHLQEQIRHIAPKLICTLGGPATKTLLDTTVGITALRGRIQEHDGLRILPAFHPAYVLRNMNMLDALQTDLAKACRETGLISG